MVSTKEKILDVAWKLFEEKGYEDTSMQDIVNVMMMSKWWIYHYFKSKDQILEAVVDTIMMKSFDEVADKILWDQLLDPMSKLESWVQNRMRYFIFKREFYSKIWGDDKYIHIRHMLIKLSKKKYISRIKSIVEEGVLKWYFNIEFPVETVMNIVSMIETVFVNQDERLDNEQEFEIYLQSIDKMYRKGLNIEWERIEYDRYEVFQ